MKGQVNDGGPAFPCVEHVENVTEKGNSFYERISHQGASLRAAAALAALPSVICGSNSFGAFERSPMDAASIAVQYADALLEALDA